MTDTAGDPVADAARATAAALATEHGPRLAGDVEAALAARDGHRNERYFVDPIALATLIVTAAQFAWSIYTDRRDRATAEPQAPPPTPETLARETRIALREQDRVLPDGFERITEIVATEIIRRGENIGG